MSALARLWHRVTGDRQGKLREEREWAALPRAIKEAERIAGLQNAQDLIEAVTNLSPDVVDREVYLRLRLWWKYNDHQRIDTNGTPVATQETVVPAESRANKIRLLELFENDPKRQVERGELLRQLGHFEEAVAVLKAVKPDGHSEVKAMKIQQFAEARDASLRILPAKGRQLLTSQTDVAPQDYDIPTFLRRRNI